MAVGFLACVLLLGTCGLVNSQLSISPYNVSSEQEISALQYVDTTLFSKSSSSVSYMEGFLHSPFPNNGCSYISPLPSGVNDSWFALISDYPACVEDMVLNVRGAGYSLIITSSQNNSDISPFIVDSGFPMALVSASYIDTLMDNVSSVSFDSPVVGLRVTASLGLSVFVVVFSFVSCCLCTCLLGCCAFICKHRRSRLIEEQEFYEYRDRQRNYEQVQRRDRLARQELIESILRQLQDLQVDLRTQIPLGRDETSKLPTRPYRSGQGKCDSCAICVEDFQESENLRWLPCEHCFHPQCIDEWLTNHSSLCPLCKTAVPRNGAADDTSSDYTDSSSPLLRTDTDTRYGSV